MLLVVWAQTAVERAPIFDFRAELKRDTSRLIVMQGTGKHLGVAVDQSLKYAVVGTVLAHKDFIVADQHLRVEQFPALRTKASREVKENEIRLSSLRCHGHGYFLPAPETVPQADAHRRRRVNAEARTGKKSTETRQKRPPGFHD